MQFCLCVSSLVTRLVKDKHEGLLCHECLVVVVVVIDDMCSSVHSFSTLVCECPELGLDHNSRDTWSRKNLAKMVDNSPPSHRYQRTSLLPDSPPQIQTRFHSADDSDRIDSKVGMRGEVGKSRN